MPVASHVESLALSRQNFALTCVLFSLGAGYSVAWLVVDVLVGLGMWPAGSDFDAVAFENDLFIINQIAFYGLNLANLGTAIALWRASKLAVPLFAISLALGLTDWVLLSLNPHFTGQLHGYILFPLEAYVVWRLYRHVQQGRLR